MNPYEPKRRVFHPERIAKLATENRQRRIQRYPETVNFGLTHEVKQDQVVVQIRRTR